MLILDKYTPEGYAAMFGCDPSYDTPPRFLGDGYLFYDFGSEQQERTNEWLDEFVGAIDRTIQEVKNRHPAGKTDDDGDDDVAGLEQLREHVIGLKKA